MASSDEEKLEAIKYGIEDASDVVLVVQNQEFHVHKMFLAARSEVFYAMFNGNFKEATEKRVEIKDVDAKTFRSFLDVLYYGCLDDCTSFIASLKATDNFTVQCKACTKRISATNFIGHLTVGKELLEEFWTVTESLLIISERFGVSEIIRKYLNNVIYTNICAVADCMFCLNCLIFAHEYNFVVEKHVTYSNETIIKWIKMMGSVSIKIDTQTMAKIFT